MLIRSLDLVSMVLYLLLVGRRLLLLFRRVRRSLVLRALKIKGD